MMMDYSLFGALLLVGHFLLIGRSIAWSTDDRCQACSSITRAFGEGLKRTKGANFGGGNTAWEERKLGRFATSETRLVDIMEKLCSDASFPKLCHQLVEEQEDFIEGWWHSLGQKIDKTVGDDVPAEAPTELHRRLCVERLKTCCPISHFGATCTPCPSDCSGHGNCHGNGSRSGDGHCVCGSGYQGSKCESCVPEGYFRSESDTCVACSPACLRCSGPGATKCDGCAKGYEANEGRCVDVNECTSGSSRCSQEREFCENTEGSFRCRTCSPSCNGCSGPGPDHCRQCAQGHQLNVSGACADINECSADSHFCRGAHQVCRNTVGSYRCDCVPGYRLEKGQCVPAPPPASTAKGTSKGKAGKGARGSKQNDAKKKNKKRIWTKRFTREFLKFIGAVGLLGLGSYLLKGRIVPVLGMAAGCGAFLYTESMRLDNAFMRKKVL